MCLTLRNKSNVRWAKGKVRWKVMELTANRELISCYMYVTWKLNKMYKRGTKAPNKPNRGIHVFLTKKQALDVLRKYMSSNPTISLVVVRMEMDGFKASGRWEECNKADNRTETWVYGKVTAAFARNGRKIKL